jgi:hypothetical protein
MRKRAREPPDIEVNKDPNKPYAYYDRNRNEIYLYVRDEKKAIPALIHELTHWAQNMFLDFEDMHQTEPAYKAYLKADDEYRKNRLLPMPRYVTENHAYLISDVLYTYD